MQKSAYRFGGPVERPYFCDREDELAVLTARMREGVHAFVLSPRRYGKTSLLRAARRELVAAKTPVGYANLLLCTTEAEVGAELVSAVVNAALDRRTRARRSLAELLQSVRVTPSVSVDPSGSVSLSFEPAVGRRSWRELIEDSVRILEDMASDRGAALILDEFQAVATIGRGGMGGAFKALADSTRNASLVFAGSHLSTMENLTSRRGAPLYGMGERLVLGLIPETKMVPYLQRRSRAVGHGMSAQVARLIYDTARAVPHYVQYLAQAAVDVTPADEDVTSGSVDSGLDTVVRLQENDFAERVESLAASQQRVLRALAVRPESRVYGREFLDRVDVSNANGVTQALRVLEGKELIERRAGAWTVVDPFLAHWLERR